MKLFAFPLLGWLLATPSVAMAQESRPLPRGVELKTSDSTPRKATFGSSDSDRKHNPAIFHGIVRSGNLPSSLRGKRHVSRIGAIARATNISSQFVACERRTDFRQHHCQQSLKSDQQVEEAALATPLSVTGTPEELDEQLPRQLVEFVETYLGLWSTLKGAK